MSTVVSKLLQSPEPSIRYAARVRILGGDPDSSEISELLSEIKHSDRVNKILSKKDASGMLLPLDNPYKKWDGAHWALTLLADLGYPKKDPDILPIIDQVCKHWLKPEFRENDTINGRFRRHASQQGNALYSLLSLTDESRMETARLLVELLLKWQWPDGGWNCDPNPQADDSSFTESLIPLRALALFGRQTGDKKVVDACEKAAEVFLCRHIYRRRSNNRIIKSDFTVLHYPCYWHYDILFALKVMAEMGIVADSRCDDALDLLESKRLPDGSWPLEAKYGRTLDEKDANRPSNSTYLDWGEVDVKSGNEWVTSDALYVLRAAGR